jgi:hypothetical protein
MSLLRGLKLTWHALKKARELRRQGIDPAEFFRRRGLEKVLEHLIRTPDPEHRAMVPEEALSVWEEYKPKDAGTLPVTDDHLALIRRTRFAWQTVEVGAPRVDQAAPYGSADPLRDVAKAFGEAPVTELARRHADMTGVLNHCFQHANIEPGTYDVEGRAFVLSPDHLTLVRELTFSWHLDELDEGPWPTPVCDPKRPYGRFTFHQKEMAIHLGWLSGGDRPLTETEMTRLTDMHYEMVDVLRVMAAHAVLEADGSTA